MKIVFPHGIGDGNVKDTWFAALCDSLSALGYPLPDKSDVIAPNYASLLNIEAPPRCPLPPITMSSLDEPGTDRLRWDYWRRQAALERLLTDTRKRDGAVSFPAVLVECALAVPIMNIQQANKYIKHEGLRGCVLRMVLDLLPASGDVVIVGHSLGSLVAIDLLDHLPNVITVQRLITIGSPAGHLALLGKKNPLLRKFPLSRVMSWANLWSLRDQVCYGRGIAHYFPHALDVGIDLGMCEHGADGYLRHQKVGMAIGNAIFGSLSRDVAPLGTAADVPLDDHEKLVITALVYGYLLAEQLTEDPRRQAKFRATLAEVQESLMNTVVERCRSEGRLLPVQFREIVCELANGRRPKPCALFDLEQAIPAMLAVLSGNVIAPYEIKTKPDHQKRAVTGLGEFLGFQRAVGTDVFDAFNEARKEIEEPSSWAPVFGLVAGGALLALGPLGLIMAAPATLAGGAAIVSALAAFGPGGMVGGIATVGGLMAAGAGTAGAAINALALAPEASVEHSLAQLLATAIARHKRGLPRDDRVWFILCELEATIARQRQSVGRFSDGNTPSVKALERKARAVRQAIEYLVDHGLGPLLP